MCYMLVLPPFVISYNKQGILYASVSSDWKAGSSSPRTWLQDPEGGSGMLPGNVSNNLPVDMVHQSKNLNLL